MRDKDWRALLESERKEHRAEIQKLLDRIQHPEIRQVEPSEINAEPPDPRELAAYQQIGLEVPDFLDVGGTDAATD